MDQLHRESDKLQADTRHLQAALAAGNMELALACAKRARRHATMITRQIAAYRDSLQSNGGHKHYDTED